MVRELPPLDYRNPELLDCDPDLVLQEGPDATPMAVMAPFLAKWRGLADDWAKAWAELLQVGHAGTWCVCAYTPYVDASREQQESDMAAGLETTKGCSHCEQSRPTAT